MAEQPSRKLSVQGDKDLLAILCCPDTKHDVSLADEAAEQPSTALDIAALEALRTAIPALRGLPLLAALAHRSPARVRLDYLSPLQLQLDVQPC